MTTASLSARLWTYQAERFPLLKHGVLIAAFGASAVCFSALLRGALPDWRGLVVAIGVLFGLFLQLRVADEHKDLEDDRRFRPERPVPRGLVTLAELRLVALAAAAGQAALCLWLDARLLALLALVWAWMALMSAEFFVPDWLKARPVIYMVSHMAVMPLIDLFATACDWLPAAGAPGGGAIGEAAFGVFLALSFANGAVIEIARKSWAPEAEREGVETYSRLWGARRAGLVLAALALLAATLAFTAVPLARVAGAAMPAAMSLAPMITGGLAAAAAWAYRNNPNAATARPLEMLAGLFVLANYLFLGAVPAILAALVPASTGAAP